MIVSTRQCLPRTAPINLPNWHKEETEKLCHSGDYIEAFYLHYSKVSPPDKPLTTIYFVFDQPQ